MELRSLNIRISKKTPISIVLLRFEVTEENKCTVSHYLKAVLAVVLFAKVGVLVMFGSPSTQRVRRLSDFTRPRTFVKSTTTKTVLR